MLVRPEPHSVAFATPGSPTDARAPARHAGGLLAATLHAGDGLGTASTFVADLDAAAMARVRREATSLLIRHGTPVTVELRYVADAAATALVATLTDLEADGIRVVTRPLGAYAVAVGTTPAPAAAAMGGAAVSPATTRSAAPRDAAAPAAATARRAEEAAEPDPFGLDLAFRARTVPFVRFMFEQYWRIDVSGLEHLPPTGAALVVANHSGAVPADAFMLAAALELRHPQRRRLRMLYDKFVDDLPLVGDVYRRLGGVTASLPNAERLLGRGEVVGLFPEGIAGVEKRCTERYRLRPFKTGTARLSVRTGTPVVPVAIVGAEEAYPVVARLYRIGRLFGLPWIPVTPFFPLCGLAGALPLPTKWSMRFGSPIAPPPADGRSEDVRVAELTHRIQTAIADGLAVLLAKRSGIFL